MASPKPSLLKVMKRKSDKKLSKQNKENGAFQRQDIMEEIIMNKIKKLVAAAIAAASIGAINVTASAENILNMPVEWFTVLAQGAPSSVNAERYFHIYNYGGGYDITCTSFSGDYDRKVTVRSQYDINILGIISSCNEKVTELHAETTSPIYVEEPDNICGNTITFSFEAFSLSNVSASGTIDYHIQ